MQEKWDKIKALSDDELIANMVEEYYRYREAERLALIDLSHISHEYYREFLNELKDRLRWRIPVEWNFKRMNNPNNERNRE